MLAKPLAEWLKHDWLMFPAMDVANATQLLGDILGDSNIIRSKFAPKLDDVNEEFLGWNSLRNELLYKNRFFPNTNLDEDRLKELLSHIILKSDEIPDKWYRARIQETDVPFKIDEMGAPPRRKASHGRANPAGIPYLYVASNNITAISEIRKRCGNHTGCFCGV